MLRCPFTVCNKSINQATRKALLCAKNAPSKMITKNKILCHSIVYMPEAPGVRSRQQRKFARKNRCKWKGLIGIKHILAWLHRLDIISSPLRHYYLLFISSILDSNKVQLSVGSKKKKNFGSKMSTAEARRRGLHNAEHFKKSCKSQTSTITALLCTNLALCNSYRSNMFPTTKESAK